MKEYSREHLERLVEELRELNAEQAQTISKYADRFATIRYQRDMWHRRAVRLGWWQDELGKWQPPPEEDEEQTFWRDRAVRLQEEADAWRAQRQDMSEEIDALLEKVGDDE